MLNMKCIFRKDLERFILWTKKGHNRGLSVSGQLRSEPVFPEKVDLEGIRREFKQFLGGKVTLKKDEKTKIAFICLDHPEKKNGFSGSMMAEFSEAVSNLEEWKSGKAVILHGNGDTFCSGGYLETVRQICNHLDGFKMSSLMQDSVLRLHRLPLISVSVVHGKALGGGAELMLSTDFRLFTKSTEVRFVEAKMGVGTGWGGGTFLQRLVGHPKALELLLTCRKITSEESLRIGLADGIINESNLLEGSISWVDSLIKGLDGADVIQTVKSIVTCDSFEKEKVIFAKSWGGQAQLKALSKNIKHK